MEQKNTTEKTQVFNLVILDKSGSMESIRKEAIDGYNETLGAIRAAQLKHMDTQDHFVSLAAFCDCGIEMIYDKTPIKDADKLTKKQYEPCCCTPLFDAIGKTVKKLKADIKDIEDAAVLVTIITDGYENSSKEWTGPAIKKLIDECKEDGWMFSFIGAGEDVDQAAELGLDCYITGEFAHEQYHFAEEAGINVISGGHYGTETMGVSLLKEKVEKELGLRTLFIDLPTDL